MKASAFQKIALASAAALFALSSASAFSFGSSSAKSSSDMHYGVVNYLNVFDAVPQGKATLQSIKDNLKPKLAALQTEQAALEKSAQDLQRNSSTLTKAQQEAQQKELVSKQQAFQKHVMTLRNGEMHKEQTAAQTFEKDLHMAIEKVASKDKLELVFNSQATPYAVSKLDITSQVISMMKKES